MAYGGDSKNKKERIVRYLDGRDLIYKKLSEIKNEELVKKVKKVSSVDSRYELSRVFAIYEANKFAETYSSSIIV